MSDTIIIRSERDAWNFLEKALSGKINASVTNIDVQDWEAELLYFPNEVSYTVNPSVVRSLNDFYKYLQKSYTHITHSGTSTKKLKEEDRNALSLRIAIKGGSNGFSVPPETINNFIKEAMKKMGN